VVNAYTLTLGGLLLLGGRTGDLYGKRRMLMIGVSLFATASPTALALVAATFAEGSARNRAMGVYGAMSGAGGATGVLMGGLLTTSLSWRWVLFVNVPIGLAVVALAPRVLPETERQTGRLDLPGALTATAGMTLPVYGLVHAATTSWGTRPRCSPSFWPSSS